MPLQDIAAIIKRFAGRRFLLALVAGRGKPAECPDGASWDIAFELTTKQEDPPPIVDYNFDNIVNWKDFAFWAEWWLCFPPDPCFEP